MRGSDHIETEQRSVRPALASVAEYSKKTLNLL